MKPINQQRSKQHEANIYMLLTIILIVMTGVGCTSDNPTPAPAMKKGLLGFRFTKNLNDITINSEAQISDKDVVLFLPATTDIISLIPEFEVSEKAEVTINGLSIVSGINSIDFSDLVEMLVVAEDQSQVIYKITVVADFKSLDNTINSLMSTFEVPGLQLAITKDEKLVYTKSFGLSDVENNIPVAENSLFRIASISKPITALAILKITESGKLNLDEKIFGKGALLGEKYGSLPFAEDKKNITVRHLLEHKSGWTNNPFDPMFTDIEKTQEDLINDMLDNRPLQYAPGSTFYYSNFGYCVLGRIIEEISGKSYEDYVHEEILQPLGITNMKIGGNTVDDIFKDEVKYYDQEGFSPYDMNISRMDSHGGWLASSTELVKLLVHVDRNSRKRDILNSNSLTNLYFGFENWLFYGSLPGTSSAISRVDDSFGYVILANTRTIPIDDILNLMNQVMVSEINTRTSWPDYDLFDIE